MANSLLNMYAKCGDSIMAKVVFYWMRLKDTSTWNTMIYMHMQVGQFDLALALFDQMTDPNIVTWNSIISGYCRKGYDIKALETFPFMLKSSSLKSNKFTLQSILSACVNPESLKLGKQIHAHIVRADLGVHFCLRVGFIKMLIWLKWLLKNCFLLIPIALANTLSACGKWDVAAKVRKSMKEIAVKKE
ncbi:hypothetical protein JHK87_000603 [Glycine soja]|nr:hypothetical protein JHK87_000603 [Glycine soja]